MPSRRAEIMLVLVTLCWGLSFPLMKQWDPLSDACPGGPALGPLLAKFTLIGVRYTLALLIFLALRPAALPSFRGRDAGLGIQYGLIFWVGGTLQVIGLALTTPAMSAFLTSLGGAWVPLLAFALWRTSVAVQTLAGLGLGLAGALVLSLREEGDWGLGPGELLTLVSSVIFAGQILFLDRRGKEVRSALPLTVGLLAISGLPSLAVAAALAAAGPGVVPWLAWAAEHLTTPGLLLNLAVMVVFPTLLAFHWMNAHQPHVTATRAALIYFLEPVFAGAFSLAFGYDKPSAALFAGGGLILAGNALAEPALWRQFSREE